MMAIFWTFWLVAMNMTPFAMMFHNLFQAAERMRETLCLCAKTVAVASWLVLLSAADQDASELAVLVCLPFDHSCASTRSHHLPMGSFSLSFVLVTSV